MSRGRDSASGTVPNWIVLSLVICLGTATFSFSAETTRVSVDSLGNQGNAESGPSAVSADGRFVAFASDATNLVAGDTNGFRDVFVHDLQTGETTRASVDSVGNQGNSWSDFLTISPDGRFVVFASDATNLVAGDTNGWHDVFVHDRQTGETTRVSVNSLGNQGNSASRVPAISADGRFVAFQSVANNLVAGDTNSDWDVFVHDRQTGETTRVSVDSLGNQGNSFSVSPAVSADGRFVAFQSYATNLVAGDTNGVDDVFVHDRQTGETTRVSVDSLGNEGNFWSFSPTISADGRFVAFDSFATNLVAGDTNGVVGDVFVHDRQTFSDADGDGIPDDSDPDFLSDILEILPDGAFKNHSGGFRTAMQAVLDAVEQAILAGDLRQAIQKLRNLRRHVDGCGATAGSNDWVTNCPFQVAVRVMIDRLIANLGG